MIRKIREEKIKATKEKNKEMKIACNMILSEIPRFNKKEDQITNEEIISIINKLIKSELILLEYSGQDESKSEYVNCLKSFLPDMINEFQIRRFISSIDQSKLKNKMQMIGIVKKHYGSKVDGNLVKTIVESL